MIKKTTFHIEIDGTKFFVAKHTIFGFCFYERRIDRHLFERHNVATLAI